MKNKNQNGIYIKVKKKTNYERLYRTALANAAYFQRLSEEYKADSTGQLAKGTVLGGTIVALTWLISILN